MVRHAAGLAAGPRVQERVLALRYRHSGTRPLLSRVMKWASGLAGSLAVRSAGQTAGSSQYDPRPL